MCGRFVLTHRLIEPEEMFDANYMQAWELVHSEKKVRDDNPALLLPIARSQEKEDSNGLHKKPFWRTAISRT